MERKGIRTKRGNQNIQPQSPAPMAAPTKDESRTALPAIAKLESHKTDNHYLEQIKPNMEYFAESDDKAEAFAFCRERMEADMTMESPRRKKNEPRTFRKALAFRRHRHTVNCSTPRGLEPYLPCPGS
ncbi:hypothetical protein [Desulfobulbus oligotrophicus]|uniref:Uncharacterized protein n=1 Tax=Desulfobulbus oligotrophicus TaxID=1909699 RepID=A0A7T6APA5_9BACT|nr:hypothetical protein [Desulfobulbus oligotrophicus]QQG64353.1 hypothetical protein HP555_13310 [Desulfobulbus oligotrophicus]